MMSKDVKIHTTNVNLSASFYEPHLALQDVCEV